MLIQPGTGLEPSAPNRQSDNPPHIIDAAVHDNLFSPRNKGFYARATYKELCTAERQFRLIEILPGSDEDVFECRLVDNLSLNERKCQYNAVSYCAGDPNKTIEIIVDGRRFWVFSNLGYALHQLRRHWNDGVLSSRFLWVDQLCINQSDTRERSHQVAHMQSIYSHANEVLIWLGGENSDGRGIEFINDVDRSFSRLFIQRQTPAGEDAEARCIWEDIQNIMNSGWWRRCWVVQELLMARRPIAIYGQHIIDWDKFEFVLQTIGDIHERSQASRVRGLSKESAPFAQKINWTVTHSLSNLRHYMRSAEKRDLKIFLQYARTAASTDLRDRVYAFIGLADAGYAIVPDYETKASDVFLHTAKRIILHEQSLDVLSFNGCSQRRLHGIDLPTWVPDWSSSSDRGFFAFLLSPGGNPAASNRKLFDASGMHPVRATFPDTKVLSVKGFIIDRVGSHGQPTSSCRYMDMDQWHIATTTRQYHQRPQARETLVIQRPDQGTTVTPELEIVRYQEHDPVIRPNILLGAYIGPKVYEEEDTFRHMDLQLLGMSAERTISEFQRYKHRPTKSDLAALRDALDIRCILEKKQTPRRTTPHIVSRNQGATGLVQNGFLRGFISDNGNTCIAQSELYVEFDDMICVLLGASVPFLIRKVGEQYKLIGEVYVQGWMHGKAVELMERGKLVPEDIQLV